MATKQSANVSGRNRREEMLMILKRNDAVHVFGVAQVIEMVPDVAKLCLSIGVHVLPIARKG